MQLLERRHQKSQQSWGEMTYVEVYVFHAHNAQHRQEHSMALVCVTQSHGLGEITDYDNSNVFRTVCLLQGLLLNSCSKSCEWRKIGRRKDCVLSGPKARQLRMGGWWKEGKFVRCWWFHCESTLSQPLWSFKNVKRIGNICHAEWVLHCPGSWNRIKIHLLHNYVKAS